MSLDTDEADAVPIDKSKHFKVSTLHDPPVEVSLPLEKLDALNIPIFIVCNNFNEGKQGYVLSIDVCPAREPWVKIFNAFKAGNRYTTDINFIHDIATIYDYLLAGDVNEYYRYVREQLKSNGEIDYSSLSIDCIKQLLAFHAISSSEPDQNLIPFEFPTTSKQTVQYIALRNRVSAACVEKPINPWLWEYLIYMCHNIEKLVSLDANVHIYDRLITYTYNRAVDDFMTTQMTNWACVKNLMSDNCVWAGGSLQMALDGHQIPETSDIDLWINDLPTVKVLMSRISSIFDGKVYFVHNRSVITVYIDKSYKPDEPKHPIQLIYIGDNENFYNGVIGSFDMDYIRCFTDGKIIRYTAECKWSHITKRIRYTANSLNSNRIKKAEDRGFIIVAPHTVIPSKIKTDLDYFFPDSRLFPVEYNCRILSKFNVNSTVVTEPDKISEIEPFVKSGAKDSYIFTEISREALNNRIITDITLTDGQRAYDRKFYVIYFNKTVVADLRNIKVLGSYKSSEQSPMTNLLLYKIDPAIIETIKKLEEHVSVLAKNHTECRRATLASKIKPLDDLPESKHGFYVKVDDYRTKVYNGVTGEEIKAKNVKWAHKTINVTVEFQGVIRVNTSGLYLLTRATKIQVFPSTFQHNPASIIGIREVGKRVEISDTMDEIADLERYETDAVLLDEVVEHPVEEVQPVDDNINNIETSDDEDLPVDEPIDETTNS